MHNENFFLTLAQISVAFTGFAGVVNTLGPSTLDAEARAFRIRSLIGWSLLSLFFSIFPFVCVQFIVPEDRMWRICSIILAATHSIATLIVWRFLIPLYRHGKLDSKNISIAITVITSAIVISLIASFYGFFPSHEPGIYLIGVIWSLALASYLFVRLVLFIQHN